MYFAHVSPFQLSTSSTENSTHALRIPDHVLARSSTSIIKYSPVHKTETALCFWM